MAADVSRRKQGRAARTLVRGYLAALALLGSLSAHVQGTDFTYQGRIEDGGQLATGLYDFHCQELAEWKRLVGALASRLN